MASSLIQTHTPDALRGRVTAIFQMDIGLWSLGTLSMGAMAEAIGMRWAVATGACLCAITGLAAMWAKPASRVRNEE